MNNRCTKPDIHLLAEEIRSEAEKYSLSCTIVVSDGTTELRTDYGAAGEDFTLDCAGGFLLGLSILTLEEDGALDLAADVAEYIPENELPDGSADQCPLQLLGRSSRLPDPLRGILLPRLHGSAEFSSLGDAAASEKEQLELQTHRSLAAQTALLRHNGEPLFTGLAPSALDEAILAELVTRISGNSPAEFVRRRILEPLDIEERIPSGMQPRHDSVFLTAGGITKLMNALTGRHLLSADNFRLASSTARGGHTLPFGRRDGILRARSCICGCTVEMLLDFSDGTGVLIASREPLPEIRRGDSFVRLDMDAARAMSARTVYPAGTRMERLSARNLADAMAVEPDCGQADFVSGPAAAIADASVGSGEAFVIREGSTPVGLLTFAKASCAGTALLDTLIIDRRYQRRGFGRIAVRWAMSYQRRKGAPRMLVCVDRRNNAAMALYGSLGFEVCQVHAGSFVLSIELN